MDDITALLRRKNKVMTEMAKKVMKILKEEVERKGLKLSVTQDGKEGKSKMIASCGFLEDELRQFSREEGVTMADSVDSLGVDLRTRVKKLGAKEKASNGEGEIEETDGSSSRQKEHDFSVLIYGSMWLCSRGGTSHLGHSVLGRISLDRKMAA